MKGARLLILVPVLLALISLPTAAAPQAGPCGPGTTYDPACDVNHDNQITITDIQLIAGHWNQSGAWVSDNQHDHLGQEWTGTNNPLKLTGFFGAPDYAALMVSNSAGNGVRVSSVVGDGVSVTLAGLDGVSVTSAGWSGVHVESAALDGVTVCKAGSTTSCSLSALHNGIEIGRTENNGMYVIEAGTNGVYANTTQGSGQWGFYTPDMIYGSNVMLHGLSLVAQVGGADALTPGDLVAAAGVADPLPGSTVHVSLVRLADGKSGGVVGVVERRLTLIQVGELLPSADGGVPIEAPPPELHSVAGPAQPGDYVAITVLGVAQVKVQDREAIQPGQRLTVSDTPGHARALRTVQVEGITVDESGPTLGVALEAPKDGMVWVLVNPQ